MVNGVPPFAVAEVGADGSSALGAYPHRSLASLYLEWASNFLIAAASDHLLTRNTNYADHHELHIGQG